MPFIAAERFAWTEPPPPDRVKMPQDHLLPYEFARDQRPSQHTPERALLLAVLADAVDIVTGSGKRTEHSTRQSLLRADTVRWFFSNESDFVFAFLTICDLFDFNAGKIRAALNLQSIEHPPMRRRGRRQIWSEGKRRRVKEEGARHEARGLSKKSESDSRLPPHASRLEEDPCG
jgi:hypothetical protein